MPTDYAKASAREPIHVALTYDEELGCLGIPHLIAAMQRWDIKPRGCVVGGADLDAPRRRP